MEKKVTTIVLALFCDWGFNVCIVSYHKENPALLNVLLSTLTDPEIKTFGSCVS